MLRALNTAPEYSSHLRLLDWDYNLSGQLLGTFSLHTYFAMTASNQVN